MKLVLIQLFILSTAVLKLMVGFRWRSLGVYSGAYLASARAWFRALQRCGVRDAGCVVVLHPCTPSKMASILAAP